MAGSSGCPPPQPGGYDGPVDLGPDTVERLDALRARGCTVVGPEVEDHAPEGRHGESVDWLCVVFLPGGEEMKGRGLSSEEAAAAAASRAEAALGLGL
jgi:hypothetical protein